MDDREARINSIMKSRESIEGWLRSTEASHVTFDAKDVIWKILDDRSKAWEKLDKVRAVLSREGI